MPGLGRLIRAAALDVGPLRRHREFRLLYVGQAVSFTGSMLTYVAIPYQVYALTGSTFVVGLLGFASLAPLLVTALIGGALADARDRRRLVLAADATLLALSAVLLVNALLGQARVWVLFLVAAGMSAAGGLQRPPLDALVPRLVSREELPAASALESLRGNVAQIAGPALAGVLIAGAGLAATYAVDVASFVVSLVALARMRAVPPPPDAAPPTLARIAEGWRYAPDNMWTAAGPDELIPAVRELFTTDPLLAISVAAALFALATTPLAFAVLGRMDWFKARRGRVMQRPSGTRRSPASTRASGMA